MSGWIFLSTSGSLCVLAGVCDPRWAEGAEQSCRTELSLLSPFHPSFQKERWSTTSSISIPLRGVLMPFKTTICFPAETSACVRAAGFGAAPDYLQATDGWAKGLRVKNQSFELISLHQHGQLALYYQLIYLITFRHFPRDT